MIRIWGRSNSVNVHKVMWCLDELGLDYERVDAGMQFGRNTEAGYLAINPNGRVPTLEDGAFQLWESNSILRYLVRQYAPESGLYPSEPKLSSSIDRWLDWSLSTLQPAERPLFWGYIRTAAADRDVPALEVAKMAAAKLWTLLDTHLENRIFVEGDAFSLGDIVLGSYARRWFGLPTELPVTQNLLRWYQRLEKRSGFKRVVAPPMT